VLTSSFLEDSKWAELRHLPLALGFVGAWSMPIRARASGAVLGTFGTYYRDVREPSPQENRGGHAPGRRRRESHREERGPGVSQPAQDV
jgi:hypothetical protein